MSACLSRFPGQVDRYSKEFEFEKLKTAIRNTVEDLWQERPATFPSILQRLQANSGSENNQAVVEFEKLTTAYIKSVRTCGRDFPWHRFFGDTSARRKRNKPTQNVHADKRNAHVRKLSNTPGTEQHQTPNLEALCQEHGQQPAGVIQAFDKLLLAALLNPNPDGKEVAVVEEESDRDEPEETVEEESNRDEPEKAVEEEQSEEAEVGEETQESQSDEEAEADKADKAVLEEESDLEESEEPEGDEETDEKAVEEQEAEEESDESEVVEEPEKGKEEEQKPEEVEKQDDINMAEEEDAVGVSILAHSSNHDQNTNPNPNPNTHLTMRTTPDAQERFANLTQRRTRNRRAPTMTIRRAEVTVGG